MTAVAEQAVRSELVTRALLRLVDLPGGPGRLALITLDNGLDPRRPSTFGPGGLAALDAAITEAVAADVVAVGITGKPWVFCAGADLTGVGAVRTREQAYATARTGHDVLRRLGELDVPSFAFVNGVAVGGGLEAALHCTYRTVATTAAPIALPEVGLGLVPGWGGAHLLPQLVGIDAAVTVAVENALGGRTLTGRQAHALGIADAVFEPADFLERSLDWAARVLRGEIVVQRPEIDRDPDPWAVAIDRGRALAEAKLHGAAPAAGRALDLLAGARTSTRDEGFAAEDDALADLIVSDQTRAALYAFHLTQSRAKRPVGAPDASLAHPVRRAGVLGAGLMASQLALLLARRLQVPVVMTDLDEDRVTAGLAWVRGEVEGLRAKGRVSSDGAARLLASVTGSVGPAGLAGADLVVEAVYERMEVKHEALRLLEQVVSADCTIATNTSSLSLTDMAAVLEHPERFVGMHFFNPVSRMPLLEVVRGEATDDAALATAFAVGAALRKSCVLVQDAPAFVVNRLLTRLFVEVMRAVDEGTALADADRALEPLGLPMSPFTLLALVGPVVQLHVNASLEAAFAERFPVSDNLRRLVDAGGIPLDQEHALVQGDRPVAPADLLRRVEDALADEARRLLDEGVVAAAQDVDTCLLLGAGWPAHLGGLLPHLDRSGAAERVTGRRFLPRGLADAPRT